MDLEQTDIIDLMKPSDMMKFIFSFEMGEYPKCWRWLGSISDRLYGGFSFDGIGESAHRISYALFVGRIPNGMVVRHMCDNPSCVNPAHLELGTHADNMKDRSIRVKAFKKGMTRMEYQYGIKAGIMAKEGSRPRTKKALESYGPEYEQMLLHAHEHLQRGEMFEVPFATEGIATTIKMSVYRYFQALRESPKRPDLAALCAEISMRTTNNMLVFFRRGDSLDAIAIRNALGLAPGFADGSDSRGVIAPSTHLDTLKRIRERK